MHNGSTALLSLQRTTEGEFVWRTEETYFDLAVESLLQVLELLLLLTLGSLITTN